MKYASYAGIAANIGEEIQSIAAQRFLPKVDSYIIKEQMNRFHSDEKTKLIMNAWYMDNPKCFPPQDCVDPLLISMHFNTRCRKGVLSKKGKAYFIKHGPVGCRDMSTKKWLEENNIPAYYSGCLTSTLVANESLRAKYPEKYILCMNCNSKIVEYVKQKAAYPVYNVGKQVSPIIDMIDRLEVAKAFLFLYQNAYCVITTNLHTAVPCLAFNTRVCLIELELPPDHFAAGRFDGMEGYFNQVTNAEFLNGAYDFNDPPENPRAFEETRDAMIEKCREFTGYDAGRPTLDDDFNPVSVLITQIAKKRNEKESYIQRALESVGVRELHDMLKLKMKGKGKKQPLQSGHDKTCAADIGEEIRDIAARRFLPEGESGISEKSVSESCAGVLGTLLPNEALREKYPDRYVMCVDCEDRVVDHVMQKARYPVVSVSSLIPSVVYGTDRLKIAQGFLFMYQNARCVVTANLQTAVSCMALGVGVCLIGSEPSSRTNTAQVDIGGFEDCLRPVTTESFLAGGYDFNDPPENPAAFEAQSEAVAAGCRELTGHDSNRPALDDDFNPVYTLISAISKLRNRDNYKYATVGDLLRAFTYKSVKEADDVFFSVTGKTALKKRQS